MSYKAFCAAIERMIILGQLQPIWWRTIRTPEYRALLRELDLVPDA